MGIETRVRLSSWVSYGHGRYANLDNDHALLTPAVVGRCSDDADHETTSLLSKKGKNLTQPRKRKGEKVADPYITSEQKSSWTFEHTFGYAPDTLEQEGEKVKAPKAQKENQEPNVVLDAGWGYRDPIMLCTGERCLSNHPLLPSDFSSMRGPVCTMCSKDVGFDGGLLSCRDCDWDICPDCNKLRTM